MGTPLAHQIRIWRLHHPCPAKLPSFVLLSSWLEEECQFLCIKLKRLLMTAHQRQWLWCSYIRRMIICWFGSCKFPFRRTIPVTAIILSLLALLQLLTWFICWFGRKFVSFPICWSFGTCFLIELLQQLSTFLATHIRWQVACIPGRSDVFEKPSPSQRWCWWWWWNINLRSAWMVVDTKNKEWTSCD